MSRPCAWCLAERGQAPQPGDSHGICPRHKAEMLGDRRYAFSGTVLLWSAVLFISCVLGLIIGNAVALTADWWSHH